MSLFSGKNDVTIDKCPFSIDGWEKSQRCEFFKIYMERFHSAPKA